MKLCPYVLRTRRRLEAVRSNFFPKHTALRAVPPRKQTSANGVRLPSEVGGLNDLFVVSTRVRRSAGPDGCDPRLSHYNTADPALSPTPLPARRDAARVPSVCDAS